MVRFFFVSLVKVLMISHQKCHSFFAIIPIQHRNTLLSKQPIFDMGTEMMKVLVDCWETND
jgi:hypothetical protein